VRFGRAAVLAKEEVLVVCCILADVEARLAGQAPSVCEAAAAARELLEARLAG
jgi:hypothetical protein